jgi:S-formylglutathione hydrolase FrmB
MTPHWFRDDFDELFSSHNSVFLLQVNPMSKFVSLFMLLMLSFTLAAQLPDTIQVYSKSMQKNIPALVVLPEGCDTSDESLTYPVLYLLHGYSGDCIGYYFHIPDLQELADGHQMILVCPDGGYNSWYLDAPADPKCRYETFISSELVGFIDSHYPSRPDRSSRAIAGLSMGGYGALFNAIRHPDVFGAAGSMSGGMDFSPFPTQWELGERLGNYLHHKKVWKRYSLVNMVGQIDKDLSLIIDVGVDDFFLNVNRNFHRKLLEAGVPHDYTERAGGHDWTYWANATRFQLLFFHHFFNKS